MNFSTLFHFTNENISIVEVRRDDLPEDSPKDEKYHWLRLNKDGEVTSRLNFVNMSSEDVNGNEISVREFEGAELRFDPEIAKFATMEEAHLMWNKSKEALSKEVSRKLEAYLRSI